MHLLLFERDPVPAQVGASQDAPGLHQVAALGPNPPYGKPRKIACSKMLVLQGSLASLLPYGKHLIYV